MARKKAVSELQTIEVVVSFNNLYRGERADVAVDSTVQGWINAGLVRLVEAVNDGTRPTRPRGAKQNDPGSLAFGAGDSSPSGDEPSQGFGAGSYGAFEG